MVRKLLNVDWRLFLWTFSPMVWFTFSFWWSLAIIAGRCCLEPVCFICLQRRVISSWFSVEHHLCRWTFYPLARRRMWLIITCLNYLGLGPSLLYSVDWSWEWVFSWAVPISSVCAGNWPSGLWLYCWWWGLSPSFSVALIYRKRVMQSLIGIRKRAMNNMANGWHSVSICAMFIRKNRKTTKRMRLETS